MLIAKIAVVLFYAFSIKSLLAEVTLPPVQNPNDRSTG